MTFDNNLPEDGNGEQDSLETPLMRAGRDLSDGGAQAEQKRREVEAENALEDVEDYIESSNPEGLESAEKEISDWKIPEDPLESVPEYVSEKDEVLDPGKLVPIFAAGSEMEAQIVMGILKGAGIRCIVDNYASRSWGDSIGIAQAAWGHILVEQEDAEEAKSVIESAKEAGSEQNSDRSL